MDSLGSSGRSNTPVFDKVVRPPTDQRVPPVDPHVPPSQNNRSFETNIPDSNNANNAELYGTLPRRKTQKSQDHVRQCNNQKLESEVYNDFLENQRRQSENVNHGRSNSGARTPVNELGPDLKNVPRYENAGQNQQGIRPYPDQSPGFKYSRMTQGLKPIPVSPPKIERQSQHTEVGRVLHQDTVSAWESNKGFPSPSENSGCNGNENTSGRYENEHGLNCDGRRAGGNNGEYLTQEQLKSQPSSKAFYSTLSGFIRTKNSKAVDTNHGSSNTVQASHTRRLQCAKVSQCEPVLVQPHDPQVVRVSGAQCAQDKSGSSVSGQKINRSASFANLIRPSAYAQPKSHQTGTNTCKNTTLPPA